MVRKICLSCGKVVEMALECELEPIFCPDHPELEMVVVVDENLIKLEDK